MNLTDLSVVPSIFPITGRLMSNHKFNHKVTDQMDIFGQHLNAREIQYGVP